MTNSEIPRRTRRGLLAVGAALLLTASIPLAAGAAPSKPFITGTSAMLALGPEGGSATYQAIISVGDKVGGYTFKSIPDGIGVKGAGKNQAMAFVNHETSLVPFPYGQVSPTYIAPTTANSFNDFDNSELSKLILRNGANGVGVMSGAIVIPSSANYQRFCSNFLAQDDAFASRPMLFTNEESPDWTRETGTAWDNASSLENVPGTREGGVSVAYDLNSSTYKTIWGMGRLNHENTVSVPGYHYPVLMTGDDTFTSTLPQSQVYMYKAGSADDVWNDNGDLWAFVADDPDILDYYDFLPNGTMSDGGVLPISGHFIQVPKEIATGKYLGAELTSATVPGFLGGPYLPPPTGGVAWQARPLDVTLTGIDGPQWVLEQWSDDNDVFAFTRIEDIAFDKTNPNILYLADSGRGSSSTSNGFASTNGRVWKMVLDPNNPTTVTSLSILIEGDDSALKTVTEIHQPDNLETTVNGLYVMEDPGSGNSWTTAQQASELIPSRITTARVWQYKFGATPTLNRIFKVNQGLDETTGDQDATSSFGSLGSWEATGMVDVSSIFGPGTFLINVQAHTYFTEIDTATAPQNVAPSGPDWTWKREGGQLLLVTIPGG